MGLHKVSGNSTDHQQGSSCSKATDVAGHLEAAWTTTLPWPLGEVQKSNRGRSYSRLDYFKANWPREKFPIYLRKSFLD